VKNRLFLFAISALLALAVLCVPPAASASISVTLADSVSCSGGYTTVRWTVEGDELSKYYVLAQPEGNTGVQQDYFLVGESKGHSIEGKGLLPGRKYSVYVCNESGRVLGWKMYTLPEAELFSDGKLKDTSVTITAEPVKLKKGGNEAKETKKIKQLDAAEIMKGLDDGSMEYGFKYTMKMPQLAKKRSFLITVAFESPDGFLFTEAAQEQEFRSANGYETLWFYMIGDRFFSSLYSTTGNIPSGEYKIHLYWNGMFVRTTYFRIN